LKVSALLIHASKEEARRELIAVAAQLDHHAVDFLSSMYSATQLSGTDNDLLIELIPSARTSIVQGSELNRLARAVGAHRTLEVGLAYGFSTIWLLDAVMQQSDGLHLAMDPFQQETWHGIGVRQARAFIGDRDCFSWTSEFSIDALARMAKAGEMVDFAYIDGNHRYDNV
jgi:predicted O-methyltransferase YrrM